jgi:hypothetical protein
MPSKINKHTVSRTKSCTCAIASIPDKTPITVFVEILKKMYKDMNG